MPLSSNYPKIKHFVRGALRKEVRLSYIRASGKFPLDLPYHIARHFSSRNDGLVSLASFEWGENFTLLEPSGKRGISHGDMIDLNRENIEDFDVREFYVGLVNGLKEKGL